MKKKSIKSIESQLQSMKDHSEDSLDSKTGYIDHGNQSVFHAKARAIRNEDNGSHL